MADPLSVSASIAGLVTITDAVFSRTFKYVKAVKGAPRELSALTMAMGALSGILHNLDLVAVQLAGQPFDTTIQANHIHSCLQTVDKVKEILDKFDSSTGGHSTKSMKRLRWPFSVSEAKDLCTEIEGHKTTLSLALTADGLSGLLRALSTQKDLQDGINGIKSELQQRCKIETRIAVTKERRRILDWIQPYDPHQNHEMSLRLRHPGTGLWFIGSDEFKSWLNCSCAKLWCYGIPGAGKTVLASSVIQEALKRSSPNTAVAFFYCDYKVPTTQDPRNILGSLACQFALQDEQSFERLRALYKMHNPVDRPSTSFRVEEIRDLLVGMASNFNDAMIVVDGLDECGTQAKSTTRLLSSLNESCEASSIKTLFLSRNEQEIREALEGYEQVSIAARSSDLRLFVGAEISLRIRNKDLRIKDESLKQEIMDRLVEEADGMFRWVVCQMDHLCELPNDAVRRKALNTLPPTLPATYERILQRVNKCSKEVQQLVQRSLRWLVCSKSPLSFAALCEAISINPGDTTLDRTAISEEDEVLRCCSSLVRRSASGQSLELAHFTVKEFLTTGIDPLDSEFGAYRFDPDVDDAVLAETCLTYLTFKDFTHGGNITEVSLHQALQTFSFRFYAVARWAEHARKNLTKPKVWSLTQHLMHPSKPLVFISWAQDLLRTIYEPDDLVVYDLDIDQYTASTSVDWNDLATASPLHFAAMLALPECCEWLLQKGCSINQSSAFGTPLECALLGDAVFEGETCFGMPEWPPFTETKESRVATVKLLIGNGADVHRNLFGRPSAMLIAVHRRDTVSCIELLRKGAVIDKDAAEELSGMYNLAFEIWEGIGTTSLRPEDRAILLDAALHSEGFSSHGSCSVLAHKSQDLVAIHADYLTPFLTAAEYGELRVIEEIAQGLKIDMNAISYPYERSALHLAASNDHIHIVKFLLEHRADYTLADSQGRTPLHASVEEPGHHRCLEFLLGLKVDANSRDQDGLTAWHLAASAGNIHALSVLRGSIADGQLEIHLRANDGRTALHCAAQSSSKETLVFLMDHYGKSIDHDTTLDGFIALHYAVMAKSLDAVQYLVDNESNVHAITNDGSNTLHCAVDESSRAGYEIIELLLRRGVDSCKAGKDGMTPIHLLLSKVTQTRYHSYTSDELETVLGSLAEDATSLDSTYGAGLTALHQVCHLHENDNSKSRPIALRILLQNGADPEARDNMGKTALMYLVEAWKKTRTMTPRPANVSDLCVTMIKVILDNSKDEDYLSTVCADPQILCLALISRDEDLAYKVLDYSPSVDATVYEIAGISGLSSLEVACQFGCSRELLEKLLGKSKVDRGAADSKIGLLVFTCKTSILTRKKTIIDLLDLGFSPNDCTVEGKSALMVAGHAGDSEVVEILIHNGADVSATDHNGWSVTHYALLSGCEALWHFLRRVVSDWNAMISVMFGKIRSWGATALHLAASLDNYALKFLLDNDLMSDINCLDNYKRTPLCIAVLHRASRNVDWLLEANANTTLSVSGQHSPLHLAASHGRMETVKVFVSRGANLLLRNNWGFTPELVARSQGHLDVANFLKGQASAGDGNCFATGEKRSQIPFGPLRLAIQLEDIELCRNLLEEGANTDGGFLDYQADIQEPSMIKGYTPFHCAAMAGNVQILQALFEKAPREILRCCQPVHPIHLAITGGHLECVNLIIDQARKIERQILPGHVCGGSYDLEHVIELPVSESGSLWPIYRTFKNTFSSMDLIMATPLRIAAALGKIDIAKSLIEHGASVDGADDQSRTPLHFAARRGQTYMIEALIRSGASVNAVNYQLYSPCMTAAQSGYLECIQTLIRGGADLTLQSMTSCTALHLAAWYGYWTIVIFLINTMMNFDLGAETKLGQSVLSTVLSWKITPIHSFVLNLAPNPSAYEPYQSNVLAATVTTNNPASLKRLLRRLPKELIPRLLAHQARMEGTPLYAAAVFSSGKVLDMLLDAGAALDLEGGDYGTPLMGACATGRLEAVRILVLKSAKTSYTKDGELFSVLSAARLHPKVTRWLLVGRFMEGPLSIENGKV